MQYQGPQKKFFWVLFRVLEFFSTTRNDRIFHFPRALHETDIGINSCILVNHTREQPNIAVSRTSKKSFLGRFRVLEFFSTARNDRIVLFPSCLQETHIGKNSCILGNYTRKNPNIAASKSYKKVFWVGFGFSIFFRLL